MLRSLRLLLGFGLSPLHQCKLRSAAPPPRISSAPHRLSRRRRGCFRAFRMSSGDSGRSPDAVAAAVAHKPKVSFCQNCGGPTKQVIPDGEEKLRAVCTHCGTIHYENPKMVVGCLVEHNDKVLLCKRKIEPSYGLWTLPAGYLEIGESAAEGAARETLEEACAEVEILSPFAQLDIPRIGQPSDAPTPTSESRTLTGVDQTAVSGCHVRMCSYIIFRAKLKKPHFSPGPESLECALFSLDDIPFGSLAFSSITVTLKMYIEDIKDGNFKFHYATILKRLGASPSDPLGFDLDNHLRS